LHGHGGLLHCRSGGGALPSLLGIALGLRRGKSQRSRLQIQVRRPACAAGLYDPTTRLLLLFGLHENFYRELKR